MRDDSRDHQWKSESDTRPFIPNVEQAQDESVDFIPNHPSDDPDGQNLPIVTSQPAKRKRGGVIREIAETALIALVIFLLVRTLVLNFRVDGTSMMPNLVNGELLIVNRNAYDSYDLYGLIDWIPGVEHANAKEITPFSDPKRGDIVVFEPPVSSNKPYIKRIIGLPGETIEIRDGGVFVDGELLDEPYIEAGTTECTGPYCGPITIPEGQIWVMGDNRGNSSDSRVFGPVDIDSVQGETVITYWPLSEFGLVHSPDYDEDGS